MKKREQIVEIVKKEETKTEQESRLGSKGK